MIAISKPNWKIVETATILIRTLTHFAWNSHFNEKVAELNYFMYTILPLDDMMRSSSKCFLCVNTIQTLQYTVTVWLKKALGDSAGFRTNEALC